MINIFTDHLEEIGETYFEHLGHALHCGVLLFLASIACIVHAFLPFVFKDTASTIAYRVSKRRYKLSKNNIKLNKRN